MLLFVLFWGIHIYLFVCLLQILLYCTIREKDRQVKHLTNLQSHKIMLISVSLPYCMDQIIVQVVIV